MAVQGLTAIVTGAASGIGEATARQLSADGANVVLANLNAETVQAIADELTRNGLRVQHNRRYHGDPSADGPPLRLNPSTSTAITLL